MENPKPLAECFETLASLDACFIHRTFYVLMSFASPRSVDSVIIKLSCTRIVSNGQVDLIVIPSATLEDTGFAALKNAHDLKTGKGNVKRIKDLI